MATATATKTAARGEVNYYMLGWKAYVITFLCIWAVVVFGLGYWPGVKAHWQMAIVMIMGSLVAGSTPMGGGTVAFPILVLVFGQPAANARNFGLIIQALGMTSAMIFILGRKVPLPFRVLAGSTLGSIVGFIFGQFVVGPHVPQTLVKLLFSCLWMSFGLLTLAKNTEICGLKGKLPNDPAVGLIGFVAGLVGGTIASMIGVGVEMMVYTAMVLIFRADLKIAVPTAVSAAALASIVGAALHLGLHDIDSNAFYNWLAAGPIVIFGAPTGTWLVSVLPRVKVLYFVSTLCVLQFVWNLQQTAHSATEWIFVVVAMAIAVIGLMTLYKAGKKNAALVAAG